MPSTGDAQSIPCPTARAEEGYVLKTRDSGLSGFVCTLSTSSWICLRFSIVVSRSLRSVHNFISVYQFIRFCSRCWRKRASAVSTIRHAFLKGLVCRLSLAVFCARRVALGVGTLLRQLSLFRLAGQLGFLRLAYGGQLRSHVGAGVPGVAASRETRASCTSGSAASAAWVSCTGAEAP
jgi:hypothetical protein